MAITRRRAKEVQNQETLRELKALPHNRNCAECKSRGTTYADLTTSAFVCTQCSGHLCRLNPPHKVKSVSRRSFSDAEIKQLKEGGNEVARSVWMGRWNPSHDREPDIFDSTAFKKFLVNKYERKQWYSYAEYQKLIKEKEEKAKHQPPPLKVEQQVDLLGDLAFDLFASKLPPVKLVPVSHQKPFSVTPPSQTFTSKPAERRANTDATEVEQREQRATKAQQTARTAEQRALEAELRARKAEQEVARAKLQVEHLREEIQTLSMLAERAGQRASQAEHMRWEAEKEKEEAKRGKEMAERRVREAEERAVAEALRRQEEKEPPWVVRREEIQLTAEELGRGGWAVVRVANFRGVRVAAKCLHEQIISNYNRDLFTREMNIAARIRHPNLLLFIGATVHGQLITLTELMPTSLRALLERWPITSLQCSSIALDVAVALNYLHLMQPDPIIHRDISSANVLLEPVPRYRWRAKLSDYGSANFLQQLKTENPGSAVYSAPEAFRPDQQSTKMDIWSSAGGAVHCSFP